MAEQDIDARSGEGEEVPAVKESGGILRMVLISLAVALVLVVAAGTTLYFVFVPGQNGEEIVAEAADVEQQTQRDRRSSPPIYYEIDPPFIANLAGNGTMRFLQVTVEVMARDTRVIEAVRRHEPVLRNNLLMLFSDQTRESVGSREAREAVRQQALEEVQAVLREQGGPYEVEQVYFTTFVLQ